MWWLGHLRFHVGTTRYSRWLRLFIARCYLVRMNVRKCALFWTRVSWSLEGRRDFAVRRAFEAFKGTSFPESGYTSRPLPGWLDFILYSRVIIYIDKGLRRVVKHLCRCCHLSDSLRVRVITKNYRWCWWARSTIHDWAWISICRQKLF